MSLDMSLFKIVDQPSTTTVSSDSTNISPMSSEASTSAKISFGVKKKKEAVNILINLLKDNKAGIDEDEDAEEPEVKKHRITHFDGVLEREVDRVTALKNSLIIPMVVESDWRVKKLIEKKKEGTLTPEEEAKLALLSSNKEEVEEKSEVLLEPSVVDADYSSVPVEAFGLAVLRGCGWKEGEGIGRSNKRVVPLVLPERRPKGLGLGNDIRKYKRSAITIGKRQDEKQELFLKKGSYVEVRRGTYRDQYGQVESFDEDNASIIIKLALTRKNVRVSQYAISLVSNKEYERNSKCINRRAYNEAKVITNLREDDLKFSKRENLIKQGRKIDNSSKLKSKEVSSKRKEMWIRPELKVRFINKEYKSGKLFNEKVVVIDAADKANCTIKDASGKMHYQICEDWLETVIPQEGSRVMVVGGRWGGNLAILEVKERRNERVVVRLLNSDEIVKVSYDDVCQFVGTADLDDY